jgi:SAM-dependent methyltransferase
MQDGSATTGAPPCDCCGLCRWEFAFSQDGTDLGRCGECGLYYVAQLPAAEARITELHHGTFRGRHRVISAELQRQGERHFAPMFRRYVELAKRFAPPGKWLDMGCGTGTLIELARREGIADIDGIELSADRLALARRITGATIHDRPIESLPLERGSIAALTMINVFSHLTKPSSTFAHLRNILVTGGIVLMQTSEIGSGARPHHDVSWDLGEHLFFLGEATIERYAAKSGFTVVHKEKVWMPETIFSRERFAVRGRSRVRDLVKWTILYTPGAFPVLRWGMLKRHAGNPVHASTIVLRAI